MFLFSFFGHPPFFPFSFFVSLSLSHSLSLSLLFFSFFLPSCFSFLFLVLVFSFCLLLGSRCYLVFLILLFVLFCFESSCLISLLCILFCCCFFVFVALVFCNFWCLATYQKHLSKIWKLQKKNQNEKCGKKDTGPRAVSTGVLTNSVIFLFFYKMGVSTKKILVLKTGPS